MANWTGTPNDDFKNLTNKADLGHGGGGSDTLNGFDGHDRLYGEKGEDFLFGGGGNDRLFGGEGDDLLAGHDGADTLNGGVGADTFDMSNHGYTAINAGKDVITDFNGHEGDKLSFMGDTGVHGMSDLKIADNANGDALVSWKGGSVTLEGVQSVDVDPGFFQF